MDLYLLLSFRQLNEKGFLCPSSQVLTMAAVIEVGVVFLYRSLPCLLTGL